VASTLAIAGLFNPLRLRLQGSIDRRFYRQQYNANQTLARFAEVARHETDLEQLTAELLHVVRETMQPVSISIWLGAEGFNIRGKRNGLQRDERLNDW
jgi:hypothetical protein